ncbi:MAG: hypothetical protein N4A46_12045 [Schleiferiaceae bacterium]|jgi:hypothetical protein|nr:hypothetical protein [Schleiferiaceae bacterium]
MKPEEKKSIENLENNSADVNEIKGGKVFKIKDRLNDNEFQHEHPTEMPPSTGVHGQKDYPADFLQKENSPSHKAKGPRSAE